MEEDELLEGAVLMFLGGEEIVVLGIGLRIVLGMVSKWWVIMCLMSSSSCS